MSRIITNVSSQIAQRISGQQNRGLQTSLERLSTGLAINRGSDNPAGLIASENLRSEKTQISAAIGNAERAEQVVNIAEGGLAEVSTLLNELQGLVGEAANDSGLSLEEKEANQQQIDQILQTIDRISETTSFQGTQLLNGGFEFQASSVHANVSDFQINAAKVEHGGSVSVEAIVTGSAQHAGLFLSAGAAALDLTDASSKFTFEVAGVDGTREFSFASGTTLNAVRDTINNFTSVTGVSAAVSGTGVVLKSTEFGSQQFVSVNVSSVGGQAGAVHNLSSTDEDVAATAGATAFSSVAAPIRDEGQDVTAIINGITARGNGKVASVNTDALAIELELTTAASQAAASFTALSVADSGAKFNIGADVNLTNKIALGLPSVASRHLGNGSTGFLDSLGGAGANNVVDGNVGQAQKVVDKAINQISSLRGRLGSVQNNVIGSTIRSLGVALENTSAAESSIRETDFAQETANLTRQQILVAASNNVLSISNSLPQSVLGLLG